MSTERIKHAYQQTEAQVKIHPVKLVDMMYSRVLTLLALVEGGVMRKDPKVRGENLGKVIAILTELSFSIKDNDMSESAQFLRGLYASILLQLPTVVINNDVKIVRQATAYIKKLQEIWGKTAMREAGFAADQTGAAAAPLREEAAAPGGGGAGAPVAGRYGVQSAPKVPSRSLSVSI